MMTSKVLTLLIHISVVLIGLSKSSTVRPSSFDNITTFPVITIEIRLDSKHEQFMRTENWCGNITEDGVDEAIKYLTGQYGKHIDRIIEKFDRNNKEKDPVQFTRTVDPETGAVENPYLLEYDCDGNSSITYELKFTKIFYTNDLDKSMQNFNMTEVVSGATCHVAKGLKRVIDKYDKIEAGISQILTDDTTEECDGGIISVLPPLNSETIDDPGPKQTVTTEATPMHTTTEANTTTEATPMPITNETNTTTEATPANPDTEPLTTIADETTTTTTTIISITTKPVITKPTNEPTITETVNTTSTRSCKMRLYYLPNKNWLRKYRFRHREINPSFAIFALIKADLDSENGSDNWTDIYYNDFKTVKRTTETPYKKPASEVSFSTDELRNGFEKDTLAVVWYDKFGEEVIGSCLISGRTMVETESCQSCFVMMRRDVRTSGTQMELQCENK